MDGQLLHAAFKAVCTNSVCWEIHLLVHVHQWHAHTLATLRKSWKIPRYTCQASTQTYSAWWKLKRVTHSCYLMCL